MHKAYVNAAYAARSYAMDMQVYKGHPEFFVFIDETGADRRDSMHCFGYSLRDKPARAQKLLWCGQHVSVIAAISLSGLLDCCTTLSAVTGPKFEEFVQQSLAPVIKPFDGVNPAQRHLVGGRTICVRV